MARPSYVNPLIERAKAECAGCRRHWRLRGWIHGSARTGTVCTAQAVRQELRDLSAAFRAEESSHYAGA